MNTSEGKTEGWQNKMQQYVGNYTYLIYVLTLTKVHLNLSLKDGFKFKPKEL